MPPFRGLLALVAVLTAAACSGSGSATTWGYSFDAGTPEQLAKGREAVRSFTASVVEAGLAERGAADATHRGRPEGDIHETTKTWLGDGFGLRDLQVVVFERNIPAEGSDITISIAAHLYSEGTQRDFRALSDRIRRLFEPPR
jgi:hypothetical protein